jgi:AdoMet-dependent rRNA methyltransferase SPB1
VALAALDKLPETTEEIRLCCADLKVLGRKEFKLLLKWRMRVREIFGFPTKKTTKTPLAEEVAVVEDMDDELRIQEELQRIKDKESSKKKKERRKENEKKQKEIVRMQMNMTAPMDIGMEQEGPRGEDSMFRLKAIDQTDALRRIAKGKMTKMTAAEARKDRDSGIGSSGETDDETDEEGDRLERELDNMYDDYRERKAAADAKYRAKKARKEHGDDEWEGVSADEKEESDEEEALEEEDDSDDSDSEEHGGTSKSLLRDLDNTPQDEAGLSKRARGFFNQDIFQTIPGLLDVPEDEESEEVVMDVDEEEEVPEVEEPETAEPEAEESDDELPTIAEQKKMRKEKLARKDKNKTFEVVKQGEDDDDDWEAAEKKTKDGRPSRSPLLTQLVPRLTHLDIDIVTAEAMTLAHQLARGEKSTYDIIDEGYNKYAFKDRDGLPDWFLDDEGKHDRPHKPISKEAASAIKEKLRAYNARPIKKVAEARARKKFKQAQKLEKLKKKADVLAGDEVCHTSHLFTGLFCMLTSRVTGYVREGEGYQHRQADVCGRADQEEGAGQGGQGPGPEPRSLWQAQGCQGPVQDGGPAHEEGDAGAEEDCEEEVGGNLVEGSLGVYKVV